MDATYRAEDRHLSVTEVAQYLKVSESYLNKLRCTGGGPAFKKFGSRVVYAVSDVEAWAKNRRRLSTSDTGKGGQRCAGRLKMHEAAPWWEAAPAKLIGLARRSVPRNITTPPADCKPPESLFAIACRGRPPVSSPSWRSRVSGRAAL